MESASNNNEEVFKFENIKPFPYVDGKINLIEFLDASTDLIKLIDHLGNVFSPVKYDMEGNIQKIRLYEHDKDSCLLELMQDEYSKGKTHSIEGVLWLNRALLFFELAFKELDVSIQSNSDDVVMKKIFTTAYEGSVKKYHNWITQQIFHVICRWSPSFPQITKSLNVENDLENFQSTLSRYNATLNTVRCQLDNFFVSHNLFPDS